MNQLIDLLVRAEVREGVKKWGALRRRDQQQGLRGWARSSEQEEENSFRSKAEIHKGERTDLGGVSNFGTDMEPEKLRGEGRQAVGDEESRTWQPLRPSSLRKKKKRRRP